MSDGAQLLFPPESTISSIPHGVGFSHNFRLTLHSKNKSRGARDIAQCVSVVLAFDMVDLDLILEHQ